MTAVTSQNVNVPTGVLWGPKTALTLEATGQLGNADEFRDMIVAYRNGAPVHLSDVGHVADDVQNNKTASWYGTDRSIVLAIQRQPGTNTVDVANRVKAAIATLETEIPPSVHVATLYDESSTIQDSVHDVTFTLELTLVLVVLRDLPLSAGNISATIIPKAWALPMSIIGTFSVHVPPQLQPRQPFTDGADARRRFRRRRRDRDAGKTSSGTWRWESPRCRRPSMARPRSVLPSFLSMTFSLAAVFIPFLFMGGIIGKLFHEFAVTIGVAILVSEDLCR